MNTKELGGYFELELNQGEHYHLNSLALNSARNCFRYVLKAQKPSKVYLPAYCCNSLIEPLLLENIKYEFLHIDEKFEFVNFPRLNNGERLLYINYFSLKSRYIYELYNRYGTQLIIDNTQAFFEKPISGVDTFYSPRKFFGVSDGGYLYTRNFLDEGLEQDLSRGRFSQLLGRYENSASDFYAEFHHSEMSLFEQSVKCMSKLTQGILKSLDYSRIALLRQRNFWLLHSSLQHSNRFKGIEFTNFVPMVYPYLSKSIGIRERLIKNKIYVAKYWKDAVVRTNQHEKNMIEGFIHLPIDQRIDVDDLNRLIGVIHD